MVRLTARQTPVEHRYPVKIQPSPEGRKDADTGDEAMTVVEPALAGTTNIAVRMNAANNAPVTRGNNTLIEPPFVTSRFPKLHVDFSTTSGREWVARNRSAKMRQCLNALV
jgi:hypothetical protein